MKTDKRSQNIIMSVIIIVLMALVIFIANNRPAKACASIPEEAIVLPQEKQWYEETLRAYNHILHRVWIDKPSYVEDVLSECDEFVTLDSLLNGKWEDTFEFYNERDSIDYYNNWYTTEPNWYEIKPNRVKNTLTNVFND